MTTSPPEIGGSAGCPDTSPADGGAVVTVGGGGADTDAEGIGIDDAEGLGIDELPVPGADGTADVVDAELVVAEVEDELVLVPPAALSGCWFEPEIATATTTSTATTAATAAIAMYRPAPGTPISGSPSGESTSPYDMGS